MIAPTAKAYEAGRDANEPLAFRLVVAHAAGYEEGGNMRTDLHVQRAALLVTSTEACVVEPFYNNIRVDATETPITDLRPTRTRQRGVRDGPRTGRGRRAAGDIADFG